MTNESGPGFGTVAWRELTVDDADGVRSFYEQVVGWTHEAVDMGGYDDFNMIRADGECVGGICHARGSNEDMPAQWLIYVTVRDVDESAATCEALGGEVLVGPASMGDAKYCVIRDPAGAVCALYSSGD
jgi:predicted enzyme related to lactoylglutathione lyase